MPLHAPGTGPVFSCRKDNDLYQTVARTQRRAPQRYDTPAEAITAAPDGSALLVLAENYPEHQTEMDAALFAAAARKHLKLYVEYPTWLPDRSVGSPRDTVWERAVVATTAFGGALPQHRILMIHGCRFTPVQAEQAPLVVARVAGYDTAVYGLPQTTYPLLFEMPNGTLVATTRLSRFISARSAPAEAWGQLWKWILDRLEPGGPGHLLRWPPSVAPSYGRTEPVPSDLEVRTLHRGIDWYRKSRMLVHPNWESHYEREAAHWQDRVGPMPAPGWPPGDGRAGLLEGFSSSVGPDGRQPVRWWRRNDCTGETAGTFAVAGLALKRPGLSRVSRNLGDWLYSQSVLSSGKRSDPANPAYGLIGWNDIAHYYGDMDGFGVYYADDQARSMLGMMLAGHVLHTSRWNDRLAACLVANGRLLGRNGFQPDRIDEGPLEAAGWRPYFDSDAVSYSPHYQSYLWACLLRASQFGVPTHLLNRVKRGIRLTMEAYPDHWNCANGSLSLEQARMLLALAWLVRVEDTSEHRAWLHRIATDLLAKQDSIGAIREELAAGAASPPASNEAYGTAETSLIQRNGDNASDLLYTVNFALLGLHEAAEATGDPYYGEAENRLAGFLCRVQVRSAARPELDGAWFRAFDFARWEYWASNADAGWGAWSVESGWTQSWITTVLALRSLKRSLWDLTDVPIGDALNRHAREMLPSNALR